MESISLNISGSRFVITKRMLKNNNSTDNNIFRLLFDYAELNQLCHVTQNKTNLPRGVYYCDNEFFIQRSPYLFEIVLQFYQTGKLHVPKFICKDLVKNELEFWTLDLTNLCPCCRSDWQIDEIVQNNKLNVDEKNEILTPEIPKSKLGRFRYNLWNIFENQNSTIGKVFAWISLLFIALSTVNLIFATIPSLQNCPTNATESIITDDLSDLDNLQDAGDITDNTDNADYVDLSFPTNSTSESLNIYRPFFSVCPGTRRFEIVEAICVVWFTMEFLLRAFISRNFWKFAKDPLNIIDLLATLPYYLEVILWAFTVDVFRVRRISRVLVFLRVMRTLRVLRVLKLARHVEELRILGGAIISARQELFMLAVFVMVTLLIFGTLMFYLERDVPDTAYRNIPASCWWSVVTLTTVGYGDVTPKTLGGKIVGAVACVTGILVIALPVTVLVEHFDDVYKESKQKRRLKAEIGSTGDEKRNFGLKTYFLTKKQTVVNKLKSSSKVWRVKRLSMAEVESNGPQKNGVIFKRNLF